MKNKVKLYDGSFYGDVGSSKYHIPKHVEWIRDPSYQSSTVFFTDLCLNIAHLETDKVYKVAWLIEPAAISPGTYKFIMQYGKMFNLVLTHSHRFASMIPNAQWYPNHMSWISPDDWKIYSKSKDICIIASDKQLTKAHQLRHKIIEELCPKFNIDIFGSAKQKFEHKVDVLKEYKFSIAIENCQESGYYSEKIVDCFATGTVPIYFGDPQIGNIFNEEGILSFSSVEELELMLSIGLDNTYENLSNEIEQNFQKAKQWYSPEDYIFEQFFKHE